MIALLGAYYWKNNQYKACKEWYRSKMLYNIGAYQAAKEGYEKLYPDKVSPKDNKDKSVPEVDE
mgnify:CR=1 FL=1